MSKRAAPRITCSSSRINSCRCLLSFGCIPVGRPDPEFVQALHGALPSQPPPVLLFFRGHLESWDDHLSSTRSLPDVVVCRKVITFKYIRSSFNVTARVTSPPLAAPFLSQKGITKACRRPIIGISVIFRLQVPGYMVGDPCTAGGLG